MRGRIASAAIGASVAKSRASAAAGQQAQAAQAQQQQAQQQIQAQQKQIETLQQQQQQQPQQQSQQEDLTQKLQKYADLKQKGLITEEEYQKLKMELLSKTWPASTWSPNSPWRSLVAQCRRLITRFSQIQYR